MAVWYSVFVVDQIYVKHVVTAVPMDSTWGRVLYSNLLAVPLLLCGGGLGDEGATLVAHWSAEGGAALLASCVAVRRHQPDATPTLTIASTLTAALSAQGLSMSYFSWSARAQLSASHFTVIGNICKVATVLLNVALWDKHATPFGLAALALTLGAAYLYEPPPPREEPKKQS